MRQESVVDTGLMRLMGLRFTSIDAQRAVATLPIAPHILGPDAAVHHGALSSVVESVASVAGAARVGESGRVVGVWNRTSFFAPASSGLLHAVADLVVDEAPRQLWSVRITDEHSRLIAQGDVELLNLGDTHAPGNDNASRVSAGATPAEKRRS